MKNWPRMPGHTTSTLNTSTSDDSALSSCWAAASLSVDDVVDVTTVALWPVFLAHASTPSLQTSNSLPTEPHEIEIPSSDFLQPVISTAAEHSKVSVFMTRPLALAMRRSQRSAPAVLSPSLSVPV